MYFMHSGRNAGPDSTQASHLCNIYIKLMYIRGVHIGKSDCLNCLVSKYSIQQEAIS